MNRLNDGIHNCYDCDFYPCSVQDEITEKGICKDCPVKCCRCVLVALVPCEEDKFERGKFGGLKMNDDGWCYLFDENSGMCTIHEKRPIACRVASCRFIREGKIPDELIII